MREFCPFVAQYVACYLADLVKPTMDAAVGADALCHLPPNMLPQQAKPSKSGANRSKSAVNALQKP